MVWHNAREDTMDRLNFRDSVAPACPKCTPEITQSMLSDLLACSQEDINPDYLEEQQRILEGNFKVVVLMLELLVSRCCGCPDFPWKKSCREQILFVNRHFNDRVILMAKDDKYKKDVPALVQVAPLIVSFICQEAIHQPHAP